MTFRSLSMCFASVFCVMTLGALPAAATPYQLTGRFDTVDVLGGEYRVGNNVWGAFTPQIVEGDTDSTAWEVSLSLHNQGGVASYPFIYKGFHWGSGTVDSGFPILVEDVAAAPFSWGIDTTGVSGRWNAAFEAWFSSTGGIAPDRAELMIWMDHGGGVFPGGNYIDTVNIGGLDWDLFHATPWSTWVHYIAYRLVSPASGPVTYDLDLKDFMDDSLSRGYLQNDYYLDNMEAGFEIWEDGQGLKTLSYSADAIPYIPGDLNADGIVDLSDLALVLNNWDAQEPPAFNADQDAADADDDGIVGLTDLSLVLNNWDATAPATGMASIPEPTGSVIILLAAMSHLRRRTRHKI